MIYDSSLAHFFAGHGQLIVWEDGMEDQRSQDGMVEVYIHIYMSVCARARSK